MAAAAGEGFSTATGVADLLAMHGLPFRTAHEIVAAAAERGADVAAVRAAARDVTGEDLSELVPVERVERALDPAESVAMRDSRGGPAPAETARAAEDAMAGVAEDREALTARREALAAAADRLEAEVGAYA
jgi:argininosuccinate lyase